MTTTSYQLEDDYSMQTLEKSQLGSYSSGQ